MLFKISARPMATELKDNQAGITAYFVINFFHTCFSVKCLSPNGLFPDPTNEFGYINCTAGSAKRIPCGIGMKWEDETKSCQRKGEGLVTTCSQFF